MVLKPVEFSLEERFIESQHLSKKSKKCGLFYLFQRTWQEIPLFTIPIIHGPLMDESLLPAVVQEIRNLNLALMTRMERSVKSKFIK